jgi:hypothetical protein
LICKRNYFANCSKGKKNQELNPTEMENLRYLQYEFDDTIQLKPLPPMSSLWSDAHVPDFTSFDKKIMKTCRQLRAHLPRETRLALKKELYVYEFVRAYLPLPLTPVEQAVVDSIGQRERQVNPSELLGMLAKEAEELRLRDSAPLRQKLGVVSIGTNFLEQFGRKMWLTNAARLMLIVFVLGGLDLMSSLLEGMDDFTQIVLANMIVAMLVMMAYPMLYMMHNEGMSRSRPVQGPGARGVLPPLREDTPEAVENVNTPRGPNARFAQVYRYDLSGSSVSFVSSENDQDRDDTGIEMSRIPRPDNWSE